VNYITSYTYSGNPTRDQRVVLQLNLRTLGGTAFSQTVSSTPSGLQ
jgi:LPS-assembly protein